MEHRLGHWLVAVRDGFVILLPLTAFGILAVLLQHFPWPPYRQFMASHAGPDWAARIGIVVQGTHGVMGLGLAMLVAVQLSSQRAMRRPQAEEQLPSLTVACAALANFMLCTLVLGLADSHALGYGGMLLGMVVGVLTVELLDRFSRWPWLSPALAPYGSERLFFQALRLTPSIVLCGLLLMGLAALLRPLLAPEPHLLAPLVAWAGERPEGAWWLAAVAALLNHLAWAVGVHGGQLLDLYAQDLFAPQRPLAGDPRLWRPLYDGFVLLGGSGATLGLVLAALWRLREGPTRRLAWLSALPAVFNINETLIFGLPLALNRHFLLPFLGVPLLLSALAVGALQGGWITLQDTALPWTTPPLLSGWLMTGSWRGAALQLVGLVLATLCYGPALMRWERLRLARAREAYEEALDALSDDAPYRVPAVRRLDVCGAVARELLGDLRRAITQGTLHLVFQPKVDLADRPVGLEALLRWRHPRHGEIPPAATVALAEQGGDIHRLGLWVLHAACRSKREWHRQGVGPLTLAVNVSPTQLQDPQFPALVGRCLAEHGLAANELELEITETHSIRDSQVVNATLEALSRLGVRLAMDDFGMGYSSLMHLRRFQVHTIKIDGSITRDILSSSANSDIVRSIAALGRARQVQVTAEYVETAAQRQVLGRLGCDQFQGYLYSRPLDAAACLGYLRQAA